MSGVIFGSLSKIFGSDLQDEKLLEALDHRNYQKLAEIGDSLLDLIIREHEYVKSGSKAESMDKARQRYANRRKNREILNKDIQLFEYLINKKEYTIPPKKIGLKRSDTYMEAIIGAIYLSKGLLITRNFVKAIYEIE